MARDRQWGKPAIIVAILGVAATFAGPIVAAIITASGDDSQGGGDQESESPSRTPNQNAAGPADPGQDSPSSEFIPSEVRVRETIRIHRDDSLAPEGADLDAVPLTNEGGDEAVLSANVWLEMRAGKSLRWTESGDPSPAQCMEALRARGEDSQIVREPTVGMRFCLETDGGRIALIQLENTPTHEDDTAWADLDVTVWKSVDD